jgi:bacteriocin-like protein
MEDNLREPIELTESELQEIAGGGGCGCDGLGIEVELEVSVEL